MSLIDQHYAADAGPPLLSVLLIGMMYSARGSATKRSLGVLMKRALLWKVICTRMRRLRRTLRLSLPIGQSVPKIHRGHELSYLLAVLAESVPDAIETANDADALAGRLHAIVHSGAATLNDLSAIAGRMQVIAAVMSHLD